MAMKFTKNVEQYTTTARTNKVKHFMEFTSKRQLEIASVLTDEELEFVKSVKGTFSFALHEDGRYMAVTLYKANAERKYNFLVLDLQEKAIAEVDSIKNAKAEILSLVEEALAGAARKLLDEALNTQEQDTKKKSRKKNDSTNEEPTDTEESEDEEQELAQEA